jgi:hypothetical protein
VQPDPVTRILLIIISLCLLALVSQGFVAGSASPGPSQAAEANRYRVNVIKSKTRGAVTLMRTDTWTGEVSLMENLFAEAREWAPGEVAPVVVEVEVPEPDEVKIFVATLRGSSPTEMRVFAAEQLGTVDAEFAVPPLIEALEGEDAAVVAAAAVSLIRIGNAEGLDAVARLRSHPNPAVQAAVEKALTAK